MMGRYIPTGIIRWLFRRPCKEVFCSERRPCWRWHVEYFTCPTCGTAVSEYDKERRDRVVDALFDLAPTEVNGFEVNGFDGLTFSGTGKGLIVGVSSNNCVFTDIHFSSPAP